MNRTAELTAAKLIGSLRVKSAIGRLDYVGRFQPYGIIEADASVRVNKEGDWEISCSAQVPYDHPSPRIITHVGIFVGGEWLVDQLGNKGHYMQSGDIAKVSVIHLLPFLEAT